jgi:hypothetical protein
MMPKTRSRKIADLLSPASVAGTLSVDGGGGGGVTVVTSAGDLPVGADAGTLAYTSDTNKMYAYNGTTWVLVFTATTPNGAPAFVVGPDASYLLAVDGSPTIITMVAQDPEGVALNWGYTITQGSLTNGGGATATITQVDNVLTITPTTTTAYQGQFTINITISDGTNIANRATNIRLTFNVQNYSYGATWVEDLPIVDEANSLRSGFSISSYGGKTAVATQIPLGITVYNTTVTPATIDGFIAGPEGATSFGLYNTMIYGDMIVGSGNLSTVKMYTRESDGWTLNTSATFEDDVKAITTTQGASTTIISISGDGLILTIGLQLTSTGLGGAANAGKLLIYRRPDSTSYNWTLIQTVDLDNMTAPGDKDYFPQRVEISPTGKNIVLMTNANDIAGTNDAGWILVLRNEDVINTNLWTVSHNGTGTGGNRTSSSGSLHAKFGNSDDIFYVLNYFVNTVFVSSIPTEPVLFQYKFNPLTNAWARYEYDPYLGLRTKSKLSGSSTQLNTSTPFIVQENGISTTDGEITFMFCHNGYNPNAGKGDSLYWVAARAKLKDISQAATVNEKSFYSSEIETVTTATGNQVTTVYSRPLTYHEVGGRSTTTGANDGSPFLNLCIDRLTGEIFAAYPQFHNGINTPGLIKRYKSARTTSTPDARGPHFVYARSGVGTSDLLSYVGKVSGIYNSNTGMPPEYSYSTTVPEGVYEFTTALIGPGGSTYGDKSQTSLANGGGGGGSLVWINNVPVFPGDVIRLFAGCPNNGDSQRSASSIWVNEIVLAVAYGGSGGSAASTNYGSSTTPAIYLPTSRTWVQGIDYDAYAGGAGGAGGAFTYGGGGGGAGGWNSVGGKGGGAGASPTTNQGFKSVSGGGGGATGNYGGQVYLTGMDEQQAVVQTTGAGYSQGNNLGSTAAQGAVNPDTISSSNNIPGRAAPGLGQANTRTLPTTSSMGGPGAIIVILGQDAKFGPSIATTNLAARPFKFYGGEGTYTTYI